MNIRLSDNLKTLRREQGNTQEELAVHLGLTTAAVSKWERGDGYPDIELLPAIAAYYGVSTDDLLGVGEIRKQEKINEYFERAKPLSHLGKSAELLVLWEEAYHEFPHELPVVLQLAYAIRNAGGSERTREVIALSEKILRNETGDNPYVRGGALQLLVFSCVELGEREKAQEYARMADSVYTSLNALYPHTLEGDELVENAQSNITVYADMMHSSVLSAVLNHDDRNKIRCFEYMLSVFDGLFPDGDYGFFYNRTQLLYAQIAGAYARLGEYEESLKHLRRSAEDAIAFDTRQSIERTSPLVYTQKSEPADSLQIGEGNNSRHRIQNMSTYEPYTPMRGDPRFIEILEMLKQFAD